jgi:hypothetical protein
MQRGSHVLHVAIQAPFIVPERHAMHLQEATLSLLVFGVNEQRWTE